MRPNLQRTFAQVNTNRTIVNQLGHNNNAVHTADSITDSNSSVGDLIQLSSSSVDGRLMNASEIIAASTSSSLINPTPDIDESIEPLKHDDDIALERLMKSKKTEKNSKIKPTPSTSPISMNRISPKTNRISLRRNMSISNSTYMQRKKRIDLTPVIIDNKRYIHRNGIIPSSTQTSKNEDNSPKDQPIFQAENQNEIENQDNQSTITSITTITPLTLSS